MESISITSMYINVGLIIGDWKTYSRDMNSRDMNSRDMELLVFGET